MIDYDTIARVNALRKEVAAVRRELSSEDIEALAMTQARADAALQPFGKRASPPISGETPYRLPPAAAATSGAAKPAFQR
jgi:hypothetical protein